MEHPIKRLLLLNNDKHNIDNLTLLREITRRARNLHFNQLSANNYLICKLHRFPKLTINRRLSAIEKTSSEYNVL